MSLIVLAGVVRRVLGLEKDYRCPFRVKPVKCPGHLQLLRSEASHHGGYMPSEKIPLTPNPPSHTRITSDKGADPVQKVEALCDFCLVHMWGHSLKTISNVKLLPQDFATWKDSRELKVMKKFPKIFPPEQIKYCEEHP